MDHYYFLETAPDDTIWEKGWSYSCDYQAYVHICEQDEDKALCGETMDSYLHYGPLPETNTFDKDDCYLMECRTCFDALADLEKARENGFDAMADYKELASQQHNQYAQYMADLRAGKIHGVK